MYRELGLVGSEPEQKKMDRLLGPTLGETYDDLVDDDYGFPPGYWEKNLEYLKDTLRWGTFGKQKIPDQLGPNPLRWVYLKDRTISHLKAISNHLKERNAKEISGSRDSQFMVAQYRIVILALINDKMNAIYYRRKRYGKS